MLIKSFTFIIYFLTVLFQNYIIDYINRLFLKSKINRHVIVLIYSLVYLIETFILLNYSTSTAIAIIKNSLSFILLLTFPLTLYRGSLSQKFLAIFETISTSFLAELITSNILFSFIKFDFTEKQLISLYRSGIQFLCSLIHIIIIYIINKILQIRFFTTNNLPIYVIFILSISILFLYDTVFITYNILFNYVILIISIIYTLATLYLINFLILLELKKITKQNIILIKKQTDTLNKYYSDLCKNLDNLSKLRNSYNDKLTQIYKLASQDYTVSDSIVTKYDYSASKDSIIKNKEAENKIVEYIITNTKMHLDMLNCKYNIDLSIPSDIDMNMNDLSNILINMINNALEAIEKYTEKFNSDLCSTIDYHLEAYADYQRNILTIKVKNIKSPSDKVKQINNNFVTSKPNKESHGYGMQIIKHIVKKYHGAMNVEYDKNSFTNIVTLKL